jgi:hypothetical protein
MTDRNASNDEPMESFDRGDPQRRCTAKRSNGSGERCRKWAIRGGNVCATHGGRAKQTVEKARRRLAENADRGAKQLLKLAFDDKQSADIRLKATLQLLDRAGVNAKTSVELEVSATPSQQIIDGIANQLEITSRDAYRRSVGADVSDDDAPDPLAGLAAQDLAMARARAERERDLSERVRANHHRGDDDVIDVEAVDVTDSHYPTTHGDHERQRDDSTATGTGSPGDYTASVFPLSPDRPGGPMDQAMTVAEANEVMAELRARDVQRLRDAGHAVIRPARRALPRGKK